MPTPTPELGLEKALDSDDNADYLDTYLSSSLTTIDSLFSNATGHVHYGPHQGGMIELIPATAIPDGSITSAKIADGSIAIIDLDPSVLTLGGDLHGTVQAAAIQLRNASGIYVLDSAGTQRNLVTFGSETLFWDSMGGGYRWVNQANSVQWMALNAGNLSVPGTVTTAVLSTGSLNASGAITAASLQTSGSIYAPSSWIAAGPVVSGSGGDLSANRNNGTGYVFLANGSHYVGFDGSNYQMPSSALYVLGDRVVTETLAETLTNKTIVNMRNSGPAAFVAAGNDLTNYCFNYYSSTVTLPQPSAAYSGVFRAIKAWGAAITVNCATATMAPPGGTAMTSAFVLNNGDSVTCWCDGTYWWIL
jgi:hypothetical protein